MIDIETLHPDIAAAERQYPHGPIVEVIDPSPGVWGGEPIEGLVDLVYQCVTNDEWHKSEPTHTHHALYGPVILKWADGCKTCNKMKNFGHEGHIYEPNGREVLDMLHRTLYAD